MVELTAGLVIAVPCMGTLKSTRMRTRWPSRSRSVIASLLERDIVVEGEQAIYLHARLSSGYRHPTLSAHRWRQNRILSDSKTFT